MSSDFLGDAADQAAALLAQIGTRTEAYAAVSGIVCRTGCGQCCLKPGIEATAFELLPIARDLLQRGEADAVYERAVASADGVCVFYQADKSDQTLGRCSEYQFRPAVCRLFGFAAVSGKNGARNLASCTWHKTLQPAVVAAAQGAIDAGGDVPHFAELGLQVHGAAPSLPLAELMPLNRALILAIEKVSLASRTADDERQTNADA